MRQLTKRSGAVMPGPGLGLTAEATSLRLKEVHITEILLVIGLGLTAEATSLRRPDLHEDSVYKMPPRLNCRGNFVEAPGRRRSAHGWPAPRLNCRGNFVEAQDMSSYPWVMQGASA